MATSKVYILPETRYNFLPSGGDVLFTVTSLAAGAGRQSAQLYFGAGANPFLFRWRAWCKFATLPVVGETIDIYLKSSDGTHADNALGTADAAMTSIDRLRNLKQIGSIAVTEASTTVEMSSGGVIAIYDPYVQIVFWNRTTDDALSATAADCGFYLEEIPYQGQAT